MAFTQFVVQVIVLAFVAYIINIFSMPQPFKQILNAVLVLYLVLLVFSLVFGITLLPLR